MTGNEWKVERQCKNVDENHKVPPPCANFVERKSTANEQCSKLGGPVFDGEP